MAMGTIELKPARSMSSSKQLDKDSIRMFKNILNGHHINDERLEESGTLPNIDGYIELLDNDDCVEAKVWVQVKHLTYPEKNDSVFYDIPHEVVAYAKRMKGEVVLFVTVDTDSNTIYWKYIDDLFIQGCIGKGIQGTYRYYFSSEEKTNNTNIEITLKEWRRIYKEKTIMIKDELESIKDFISVQKKAFDLVPSGFHGLSDSYIEREAVHRLLQWIIDPLQKKDSNVMLLVGKAGVGKSVIIKSLIQKLDSMGLLSLSIKADRSELSLKAFSLQTLQESVNLLASQFDKIIVIVDQIDALSQCLSNDRNKLNSILNLVSSLKKESNMDIRIVISCRQYDLLYDSSLRQIGSENTIELGELPDEDVKCVVNRLYPDIYNLLSNKTKQLLKTAQFLDTFCRIYRHDNNHIRYENYIDLYDELWNDIISNCPKGIDAENVVALLFDLAEKVQKSETLSPTWAPGLNQAPVLNYLASEGIVIVDNGHVSFFHQTFLDYTLARNYTSCNRDFINDLEQSFQGLELRSKIKCILEYVRYHSEKHYKEAIVGILESDRIRIHIKIIALSIMASSTNLLPFEIQLAKKIKMTNEKLFVSFLTGATSAWLPVFYGDFINEAVDFRQVSNTFYPILTYLFRNASICPDDIACILNTIKDDESRKNAVIYYLSGYADYSKKSTQQLFSLYICAEPDRAYSYLMKSMDSDIMFTMEQVTKYLLDFFLDNRGSKHNTDNYELVEVLCKKLYAQDYRLYFEMMIDIFLKVVERKEYDTEIYWYKVDYVFDGYTTNDYTTKLYKWLEDAALKLAKDVEYIRPYQRKLFETKSDRALCLCFEIMTVCPSAYYQDIDEFLSTNESIDRYLEESDFKYYFLELLKAWYLTLGPAEALKYQKIIYHFSSHTDNFKLQNRPIYKPLCPYMWQRKWELLYTIDGQYLNEDLRRCRLELNRRFGKSYVNEKHEHMVITASICGGLTSSEKYRTFSKKAWLNSFLISNKEHLNRRFFDERVHADEFITSVSAKPNYYKDFVLELFANPEIDRIYCCAGLIGLLQGGCQPLELLPLFRQFMTVKYIEKNSYNFKRMARYYNDIDAISNELLSFYCLFIKQHIIADTDIDTMNYQDRVNKMLNSAINSIAGIVLDELIDMASSEKMRPQVYDALNGLCRLLTPSLRLLVIYSIYVKDLYDEQLMDELLAEYIPYLGVEALYVRPDLFQSYYYFKKNSIVDSFFSRIQSDDNSHEILAQIYFWGTSHNEKNTECLANLNKLLDIGYEDMVIKIVRVAFKHYSDIDYSDISRKILCRYANDERERVRDIYLFHCNDLPVNAFHFFQEISINWKPNKRREIYEEIKYLSRCSEFYPKESYCYIERFCFVDVANNLFLEDKLTELMIVIYKKLKLVSDQVYLNKLMDLFDDMILRGNQTMLKAIEVIEE